MKIKKAVIPAAGFGTRMLPITRAQPKEMLPIVHKPVIQYVVEEAYHSGIKEILIITGKHKRAIEDHFDRHDLPKKDKFIEELERMLEEVDIYFVKQREQKGLGDAVRYAEAFVGDEPFALLLGDNITIPNCTRQLLKVFEKYKTNLVALEKIPMERVERHGVVRGDFVEDKIIKIEYLVEKPKPDEAPSNIVIIGRYILNPTIFDCLNRLELGVGEEIQLTDGLKILCKREAVYGYLYEGKRYDIGEKSEWLRANFELALEDNELRVFVTEWLKNLINMGNLKF